jgi:ribosomal-protein-alanine N-acetyltransferase
MPSFTGRIRGPVPGEGKAVGAEGKIRRLRAEDAPKLVAIVAATPVAAKWSAESYEKLSHPDGNISFVHESQGRITGFILGRQLSGEAEVLNLAVRPGNRKRGIGGSLLQAALEEFGKLGVGRVYLEVREANKEARRFYQNRGFTVAGVRPNYYREPDEAAVLMEKRLTG